MPFWYFFKVPELPSKIAHQSNQVQIRKYLVREGAPVEIGTPVALVENWWAGMVLKANGKGLLTKRIFEPGTQVKVGDPIAVIGANGENIPYERDYVLLEVTQHKRRQPDL